MIARQYGCDAHQPICPRSCHVPESDDLTPRALAGALGVGFLMWLFLGGVVSFALGHC